MNSAILPLLLICATCGLSFALAPPRTASMGLAAMAAVAMVVSAMPFSQGASDLIFRGLWASVIITAALTYARGDLANRLILPSALNAGCWAGAFAGLSGERSGLLLALFLGLIFIPARWFTLRGYHVVVKVVASWMIAIASLSMFVAFMPTPGYKPDHME